MIKSVTVWDREDCRIAHSLYNTHTHTHLSSLLTLTLTVTCALTVLVAQWITSITPWPVITQQWGMQAVPQTQSTKWVWTTTWFSNVNYLLVLHNWRMNLTYSLEVKLKITNVSKRTLFRSMRGGSSYLWWPFSSSWGPLCSLPMIWYWAPLYWCFKRWGFYPKKMQLVKFMKLAESKFSTRTQF